MKTKTLPFRAAGLIAQLRGPIAAVALLLPGAFMIAALPTTAVADPAAAEVRSLEVRTDADLGPGSRLSFRAMGTPRAQVAVRVQGVRERIALRESAPGVYTGRYTVKRGEVIQSNGDVRAVLRLGKRTATEDFTLAEVMAAPPVAVAPQPIIVQPPPPPLPPLRIERFGTTQVDRLEPGVELRFALEGAPGGTVIIDLPGVANDIALREVRPGVYEGGYTLRRADNLNLSRPIVASLRVGDRVVTSNLAVPVLQPQVDNRPPQVVNIAPRDGDAVPGGPIQVSGNFEDRGGSGVDPASVRIMISGRNVTPDAQVTPTSFNFRANLPPGRYAVEVTARDRAGNAVRRDWSFDVGGVVPVALPLQIMSPGNGASVEGGATTVSGRTAPFATVQAKVDANLRVQSGFGVEQQVYAQTLQADANGNFAFTFSPRLLVHGTRYEVTIAVSKAGVTSETRMTLYQR